MDVILGRENSNSIERIMVNAIKGFASHNDIRVFPHPRENLSRENKIKDFNNDHEVPRHDRLFESMEVFSDEINMRFSEEMDYSMNTMHSQINRAINSAIRLGDS